MSRLLFAAAAAAITLATPAAAHEREFTHDGVTFKYSIAQDGNKRIVRGRASEGSTFRLIVRGDRVSGTFGGNRVEFAVPASAKSGQTVSL